MNSDNDGEIEIEKEIEIEIVRWRLYSSLYQ